MLYDFILPDSFFLSKIDENNIYSLVNNRNFLLFWLEDGAIELQTIQWRDDIQIGKLYLFGPAYILSICAKKDFKATCIGFSMDFIQKDAKDYMMDIFNLFFFNMGKTPIAFTQTSLDKFNKLSDLLEYEINDQDSSPDIIHAILKLMLLNLIKLENIVRSLPDINIQRLHDFFMLLHNHYIKEKEVGFYASQLNLSTRRLNQILHIYFQKSASYMIQEYVLTEAKRLLYTNEININEIANHLGFEERAYFSLFFKRKTGLSPKLFKNKILHGNLIPS